MTIFSQVRMCSLDAVWLRTIAIDSTDSSMNNKLILNEFHRSFENSETRNGLKLNLITALFNSILRVELRLSNTQPISVLYSPQELDFLVWHFLHNAQNLMQLQFRTELFDWRGLVQQSIDMVHSGLGASF